MPATNQLQGSVTTLLKLIPARWAVAAAALFGSALGTSIARAFLSVGR